MGVRFRVSGVSDAAGRRSGRFDRIKKLLLFVEKFQITNNKQITMTKIQNSKPVWVIEYSNLRFVWNLLDRRHSGGVLVI
jgi:hypothetical protein